MAEGDVVNTTTATTTLLDELRATAASLADLDNAPDHIEVDHHGVSALLSRAVAAIESAEAAREAMRRERTAALNERDEATERANRLHSECVEYAGHVVNVERERDAAYAALRDGVKRPLRCDQCVEPATQTADENRGQCYACDAHAGACGSACEGVEHSWPCDAWHDLPHAAAIRAATKAVA